MKTTTFTLLLLFSVPVLCQNKDTTYKYWMPIGIAMEPWYYTLHTGYCFSIGDNFYKAGYFVKTDPLGDIYGASPGKFALRSFSALIGKRVQWKWFAAYAFGGISYVDGSEGINDWKDKIIHTVGLQAEIHLLLRPANEVGIGLSGFANANAAKCFVGSTVTLTIGNGK
jgi:hypothetical protein